MAAERPITETTFWRLVPKLSAEQLRRFPQNRLPPSIPLDAVDAEAEPEKWAALEHLAWVRAETDVSERADDAERGGNDFRHALDVTESATAAGANELDALCDGLREQWRGEEPDKDPLSDVAQTLERARRLAAELGGRVAELHRALGVIDRACVGDDRFQARVGAARQRAKKALARLEWVLGRFHLFELDIACGAMRSKEVECEQQMRRLKDIEERIAAVEAQLRKENGLAARVLRPRVARQQRERLLERLQTLTARRDSAEIFISEDYLLRWLDVLVNTSLYTDQEQWRQKARQARLLLYRLLNTYCLQQELAAHQVATRAVLGVNAREAINYYLKSEQFILSYFARKRQEVMSWLAGAAETKLGQLEDTRDAILTEYRRHARSRETGEAAPLPPATARAPTSARASASAQA